MWSLSGLLEWHFKELVSDGNARYTSRPLKLTAEEIIFSTICNSSDLALWFRHAEIVPQNPDSCFSLLNLWSLSLHPMAYKKNRTNTFQTCSDLHMYPLFLFQELLWQPKSAVTDWLSESELGGGFFCLFSVCWIYLQRTWSFLSFFFLLK